MLVLLPKQRCISMTIWLQSLIEDAIRREEVTLCPWQWAAELHGHLTGSSELPHISIQSTVLKFWMQKHTKDKRKHERDV